MGDAVASQTLLDDAEMTVMKFTNISDGTGESAVKKVDVSALTGAPATVKIMKIIYATYGMGVRLLWDATSDVFAVGLGADDSGCLDFTEIGGLVNTKATGYTGDVVFTTIGHAAGDSYTVILVLSKTSDLS